jgi:hypothetical protein
MADANENTEKPRPISKKVEWKLLYQRVDGNGNRPGISLSQINRRVVEEEPVNETEVVPRP